jgi:hypothetical protein
MSRTVSLEGPTPEQARIHRVRETLHRDGATPGGALEGLAAIVEDDTWRRVAGLDGKPFPSFRAFVEARPPFGLGIDEPELRKIISLHHPHERSTQIHERMEAMRAAVKGLLADELATTNTNRDSETGRFIPSDDVTPVKGRGNSETYIVRRLKRDRPDLAELVLDGKVTARAAGIAAGFVPRTATVPIDDPDRLAATLRRRLSPAALDRLRELLG